MASIELKGLSKVFGKTTAVHPLDISIEDGSFTAIVGPSGCGKSTLLNLIAGLEQPSGGDIIFDGRSVIELSPKQRDVAFVFQNYALYPHKTVYQNIAFPLTIANADKDDTDKRVHDVARLLGIEMLLDRKPRELSGGQRQRVALGRAIIRRPKVFLLDEPLSNLDARLRVQTRAELKKLHRTLKTTFIYVTHDQTEAMSLADTIAVLKEGHLLQTASPETVYNRPANTFVGSFMGSPGMNFITAVLSDNGRKVRIGPNEIELPSPLNREGEILVGLRPEHLSITDIESARHLNAEIQLIEPLGSEALVEVKIGEQTVIVREGADIDYRVGDRVKVNLDIQKANFFDSDTGVNIATPG